MKDFTLKIYENLIRTLKSKSYKFLTVKEYFNLTPMSRRILGEGGSLTHPVAKSPNRPLVIMRHDVDRKPQNALRMAKLENELGIKATYYFRTIPKTFKPEIIKQIIELGHEIGYHYECLSETNGNYEKAIEDFEMNLSKLRELYPVKNIAMHGRPTSKWDSRLLWEKYDYKQYGILSEPYFDIDFNEVLYITDAGRSWNNESINLRDKVDSKFNFTFNHTQGIIQAIEKNQLPDKIMINIHPEHWADSTTEWWKIWIVRKIKNFGKRILIRGRARRRKSEV